MLAKPQTYSAQSQQHGVNTASSELAAGLITTAISSDIWPHGPSVKTLTNLPPEILLTVVSKVPCSQAQFELLKLLCRPISDAMSLNRTILCKMVAIEQFPIVSTIVKRELIGLQDLIDLKARARLVEEILDSRYPQWVSGLSTFRKGEAIGGAGRTRIEIGSRLMDGKGKLKLRSNSEEFMGALPDCLLITLHDAFQCISTRVTKLWGIYLGYTGIDDNAYKVAVYSFLLYIACVEAAMRMIRRTSDVLDTVDGIAAQVNRHGVENSKDSLDNLIKKEGREKGYRFRSKMWELRAVMSPKNGNAEAAMRVSSVATKPGGLAEMLAALDTLS